MDAISNKIKRIQSLKPVEALGEYEDEIRATVPAIYNAYVEGLCTPYHVVAEFLFKIAYK